MAAHAVSMASRWSIAAVLACDRCDGVCAESAAVASARRLASAAVASQRAQQLGVLCPLAAQPRRANYAVFASRRAASASVVRH